MSKLPRTSPLEAAVPLLAAPFYGEGLKIRERSFLQKVVVKGDPADPDLRKAMIADLGADIPMTPNEVFVKDGLVVLWLGPKEWLVVASATADLNPVDFLLKRLNDGPSLAVDVSDQRTIIEVSGQNARNLLSRGTSIDLRASVFSCGRCCQTVFATAGVILHCKQAEGFDLYVDQTFAEYVLGWLVSAADPSSTNLHRWDCEQ